MVFGADLYDISMTFDDGTEWFIFESSFDSSSHSITVEPFESIEGNIQPYGTTFTVTIPAGIVESSFGLPNREISYIYTTVEEKISISSDSPLQDQATGIPLYSNLVIGFTSPFVSFACGDSEHSFNTDECPQITLMDSSGQAVYMDGGFDGWLYINLGNYDLEPDFMLQANEAYTLTFPAGVLKGDSFDFESIITNDTIIITFTTEPAPPLNVDFVYPFDGSYTIEPDVEIYVSFNDYVEVNDLSGITLTGPEGVIPGVFAWLNTSFGNRVYIGHDDFTAVGQYTVTFPAGAVRSLHHISNEAFTFSFEFQ